MAHECNSDNHERAGGRRARALLQLHDDDDDGVLNACPTAIGSIGTDSVCGLSIKGDLAKKLSAHGI